MPRIARIAVLFAATLGCGPGCLHQGPGPRAVSDKTRVASPHSGSTAADSFERSIKPMLVRSCTPCHVPGGKMYDRLPFDNPEVVRSRLDGIVGRLKAPEDQALLQEWAKLPPVP